MPLSSFVSRGNWSTERRHKVLKVVYLLSGRAEFGFLHLGFKGHSLHSLLRWPVSHAGPLRCWFKMQVLGHISLRVCFAGSWGGPMDLLRLNEDPREVLHAACIIRLFSGDCPSSQFPSHPSSTNSLWSFPLPQPAYHLEHDSEPPCPVPSACVFSQGPSLFLQIRLDSPRLQSETTCNTTTKAASHVYPNSLLGFTNKPGELTIQLCYLYFRLPSVHIAAHSALGLAPPSPGWGSGGLLIPQSPLCGVCQG